MWCGRWFALDVDWRFALLIYCFRLLTVECCVFGAWGLDLRLRSGILRL